MSEEQRRSQRETEAIAIAAQAPGVDQAVRDRLRLIFQPHPRSDNHVEAA